MHLVACGPYTGSIRDFFLFWIFALVYQDSTWLYLVYLAKHEHLEETTKNKKNIRSESTQNVHLCDTDKTRLSTT